MTRTARAVIAWTTVAAALACLAWAIVAAGRERSVVVLNPLDEPVTVRLGAAEVKVSAGGRLTTDVPTGVLDVLVKGKDGRIVDRHRLHVPLSGAGQAIYAVLGAAPLYRVDVIYTSQHAPRPRDEGPTGLRLLLGERFQLADADYLLRKPPEQIELPAHSSRTVKTLVDVAPGGWRRALQLASSGPDGLATTGALARRLHRAMPGEWYPFAIALETATLLEGPDAAAALAEAAVRASPESADAHRSYIHAMRQAGRLDELRRRYLAPAAQAPSSPLAAAMRLRVLPRAEAEAAARAALRAFPDDRQVQLAAAHALLRTGHAADAVAVHARIPLGPSEDNGWVEAQVRALLLAGRTQEALAAALAAARVEQAAASYPALYVRVARLPGAKVELAPETLLQKWAGDGGEEAVAWVRAQLGELDPHELDRLDTAPSSPAAPAIMAWATREPGEALDRCRRAGDATLMALPDEIGLLLALEAHRTGDRALYRRLALHVPLGEAEVAAWIDRGIEPAELWRLSEDEQAAFALARARRLRASGQPVPPGLALAASADRLQGAAYWAAQRWPRPARAAPPVQLVLQPAASP